MTPPRAIKPFSDIQDTTAKPSVYGGKRRGGKLFSGKYFRPSPRSVSYFSDKVFSLLLSGENCSAARNYRFVTPCVVHQAFIRRKKKCCDIFISVFVTRGLFSDRTRKSVFENPWFTALRNVLCGKWSVRPQVWHVHECRISQLWLQRTNFDTFSDIIVMATSILGKPEAFFD